MTVVYIHQYFNTPEMPGGTRSYEMARRLVAQGHSVRMLTADRTTLGRRWRVSSEEGIEVHWTWLPYRNDMSFVRRVIQFIRFMARSTIRAVCSPGDVVFATSTPLTVAVPGVIAARLRRRPFVFEVRDLWPEMPIAAGFLKNPLLRVGARALERFAYRHANAIIALSPDMKRGIVRSGISAGRVTVIPNSSDISLFRVDESEGANWRERNPWVGERPLVAYVGTLGYINGLEYVVNMAHSALEIDPSVRFIICGTGSQQSRLVERARDAGVIGRNLAFTDPIAKSEVPALLSAASVALSVFRNIPEMWANSANKFFDALASATPVAINYRGWQAELLREYEAGLVLPPEDPAGGARSIIELLHDSRRLADYARNAGRLGGSRFSRDKLYADFAHVLQSAVAGHNLGTARSST